MKRQIFFFSGILAAKTLASPCGDAPEADNGFFECENNKCTLNCDGGYGWKRPGTGPSGKKLKCIDDTWVPVADDGVWPVCTNICPEIDEARYLPNTNDASITCTTLGGDACVHGETCSDGNECYVNCDHPDYEISPLPNSNTLKCACNGARCKWTGGKSLNNTSKCIPKQLKRIIGGQDGNRGEDGYTLSIGYYAFNRTSNRREWVHFCGGVLVTSNWAITAAHCRQARLRAIVGDYHLNKKDGSEVPCRIVNQIRHPDYDQRTKNDIMMMALRCKKLQMGRYIQPAILPRVGTEPRPGTNCRICGWGNTHYPIYVPATTLQCVTLPIIDTDVCNGPNHYVGSIHEKIMCIGNIGVGMQDSCQGDSGGPANCNGVIYGIVMGGLYCAKANYPGVYTKTAPYIPWFRQVIASAASARRNQNTRGRRTTRG